jgi:hypothetical protein
MEMSSRRLILDTRFSVKQKVKSSGIVQMNVCMASLYFQEQCFPVFYLLSEFRLQAVLHSRRQIFCYSSVFK